jgi:uncharacterized membrane protein
MKEGFMGSRLPKLILTLLAAYAALHFSWYYQKLPDVVASHFDVHGIANGWQTKPAFFRVFAMVSVLAAAFGFGLPRIITKVPAQLINLPNKQYWLSPEHLAETQEFLSAYFACFGCALFVVMISTFDYAMQSNLHPENRPDISRMWYTLAGFLAFVVVWIVRMLTKFLGPGQEKLPR